MFEHPEEFRPERARNPHMGFGSGKHACLGAAHARALLRVLLRQLGSGEYELALVKEHPAQERLGRARRRLGFSELWVRF